eukprot:CAMPEP_0113421134 /NCGR_PEP_ID=MMETSP0013_2-20120614/27717_1 /TAXON_ID=2843 ORGANISM="Skeletonema costatum, Strain 1716" /NCGR_SAMPLE_ID=MMETSP0013_2 /ASSEMBLY_ACC=CAM_ASM_000158 /LENGTH=430 /DNA_ID=CAMNT_0000308695 /DNA_START=20 /DNA_END=1312 /DNA_ORIENTATION=- /assembly_acc=CAM_ASM_000158
MPSSKKKNKVKAKKNAVVVAEKNKEKDDEAFLEEAIKLAAAEENELKAAAPASNNAAPAAASFAGKKEKDTGGENEVENKVVFTTPSELVELREAMDACGKDMVDAAEGNISICKTMAPASTATSSTAFNTLLMPQGDLHLRSEGIDGMLTTASMVQLMKNPLFRSLCDAKNIDVSSGNKQNPHQMALEHQLKELQLSERGGSLAAEDQCMHGWCPWLGEEETEGCKQLCDEMLNAAVEAAEADVGDFIDKFAHGMQTSLMKRVDVWGDVKKLEHIKSYFLSTGTKKLVEGSDGEDVAVIAYFARFFEQYIESFEERKPMSAAKTYELLFLDHRTIVSFFKNRIECKCLDEEYDKVKDMPKLGICSNFDCKLPKRRVERSKLHCCSKCRQRDYCSRACQKADWSSHKKRCGMSEKLVEKELQKYQSKTNV